MNSSDAIGDEAGHLHPPEEADMTIRSCIYTEIHLIAALEMMKERPELHSVIPLLQRVLAEVGAVKQTHSLLSRVRAASGSGSDR